jgi:hypothetical protein
MSRKKVGGDSSWILPAVVGVGILGFGYLIAQKLGLFSQSGGAANNKSTTDANTSASAASTAAAAAAGVKATINDNEAANIANQVYGIGTTASTMTDLYTITQQLTQVNNVQDLNMVISAFGTKQMPSGNISNWTGACTLLGISCTSVGLGDWVRVIYQSIDPTGQALSNLDSYFSEQGINYSF